MKAVERIFAEGSSQTRLPETDLDLLCYLIATNPTIFHTVCMENFLKYGHISAAQKKLETERLKDSHFAIFVQLSLLISWTQGAINHRTFAVKGDIRRNCVLFQRIALYGGEPNNSCHFRGIHCGQEPSSGAGEAAAATVGASAAGPVDGVSAREFYR